MDAIIKTTTRLLVPLIMVFGFYVSLHGHISPGGGFPGGVILASAFLLLVIAFTEKGLYMIATILKSNTATSTTIAIIETFAKVRNLTSTVKTLSQNPFSR